MLTRNMGRQIVRETDRVGGSYIPLYYNLVCRVYQGISGYISIIWYFQFEVIKYQYTYDLAFIELPKNFSASQSPKTDIFVCKRCCM